MHHSDANYKPENVDCARRSGSGAPNQGFPTDLMRANITSTAYDAAFTIITKHGTTESASPLTALTSGAGWTNTTTAASLLTWRAGGGLATGYISYVPFKSSGGMADPDGVYALFDTECVKGAIGGYNASTNPILKCTTDILIGASVAQNTSPTETWFGISSMPSGCLPGSSWAQTSPTQTLTLGANTAGTIASLTASSALFNAKTTPGTVVDDGTGYYGWISYVTDITRMLICRSIKLIAAHH